MVAQQSTIEAYETRETSATMDALLAATETQIVIDANATVAAIFTETAQAPAPTRPRFLATRVAQQQLGTPIAPQVPNTEPQNAVEPYTIALTEQFGNLTIQWTNFAMADRGDGTTFYNWAHSTYPDWNMLNPAEWATAPNEPNPLVSWFNAANGIEIPDEGERNYCQVVEGEWCTNVAATGHYMLYTGDGMIPGLWDGMPEEGIGHAFSYWNVGSNDARLDGVFLQGWRGTGRFFNGDALSIAIVATHGHAANQMLDLLSELNPEPLTNGGSNCSNRDGCLGVEHEAVIGSGNAPLAIITATTTR